MDRLETSGCPSSSSVKSRSQNAMVSASLALSIPAARQVVSRASTMKVEKPGSYW